MVKLLTKLINNTNKELAIYEQSSNGAQTRVALLGPKHVSTTKPTTTDVRPEHVPTSTPTTTDVRPEHVPTSTPTTTDVRPEHVPTSTPTTTDVRPEHVPTSTPTTTDVRPEHVPTSTPTTTDVRPEHVPTSTPTTTDVRPQHVATTTPTTNYVSENSRSTPELPYFYEYCVDPNDSYATIRIWCGMKAVLSVSSDEAIDYRTITIGEVKDGVFEKQLERRNVKKKPASTFGQLLQPPRSSKDAASTSEGDASNKKDLFFKNFFRPHK